MDLSTLYLIIGSIGAFCVLFAFVQNQRNAWGNDSFKYDFLNALGSLFLLIYAIYTVSIPFIVTNLVWGTLSVIDVIKGRRKIKE
jgi:hypothetical protein